MQLIATIRTEIQNYRDGLIKITDTYYFSQYNLTKRIFNLANKIYPTGNIDSQGNYKYWYDIITPRINDETKNIDFDTKDITLTSKMPNDATRIFLANCLLQEWLKETKQGISLNEDIEMCTGWGNMLWKKVKGVEGGKVKLNFLDVYIVNQKAESIEDTPIIERHLFTSSQLRAKRGVYDDDAIDEVLKDFGNKSFVDDEDTDRVTAKTKIPVFELFERNGEVNLKDLKDVQENMGKKNLMRKATDEHTYVIAKVITALSRTSQVGDDSPVLFAEEIGKMSDVYKEYHRGRYNGRWFREGFYEQLADIQIRSNQLGNEIARALEYAGKQIYVSDDDMLYKNVLTDMMRGDIIKAKDIKRLDMTVPDIANFITEWNNLQAVADKITNSNEIIQGGDLPAGTPFKLGALLNQNSAKMYTFIREKLALAFQEVYQDWIFPELMKKFRSADVIRITGDKDHLDAYHKILVDNWYAANLMFIGAHGKEEAVLIKEAKLELLLDRKEEMAKVEKEYWKGFMARVSINITGEAVDINTDVESRNSLIALEVDPIRRSFLLDTVWAKLGIDTTKLPKPAPAPAQPIPEAGGVPPAPQLVT